MHTARSGMTLLELLIVLVVVGVLASLAVPAYRGHLLRTHRVEAIGALLALAAAQEKFYLQHDRYAAQAELSPAPPGGLGIAARSNDGRYALAIEGADAGGFTATAQAIGGQAADTACAEFRIDAAGERSATNGAGSAAPRCWQ